VRHHGAGLLRLTKNERLLSDLQSDFQKSVHLTDAEKAMLEYSVKLTRSPASLEEADIAALRSRGFSDQAILEINLAASYMNFVNRIADGLGVQLETSFERFTR
jgi:uncharacterized peroxidase-related enzyme